MKRFAYFLLSTLMCVSCLEESADPNDTAMNSDYYRMNEISVTNEEPGVDSKSIITVDPQDIKNLHVFAFDPNTNKILIYDERAGADLNGKPIEKYVENTSTFSWCLPTKTEMSIYAVANIGMLDSPATIEELKSNKKLTVTYNNLEEINTLKSVPMSGVLENVQDNGNSSFVLYLKSILARYDIKFKFREDAEGVTVTQLGVFYANKTVSLFAGDNAIKTTSEITQENDYTTSLDIEKLNNGEAVTLYMLENLQTTVNGATSTAESWRTVKEYGENLDFCTKLYISVLYPDGQKTNYSLYLGQNATNNFDIIRNIKKTITINITGEEPDIFDFLDGNINVKEGETCEVGFTADPILSGTITADCFETDNDKLTIQSVTYDEATKVGKVTIKAGFVSEDVNGLLKFKSKHEKVSYETSVAIRIVASPPQPSRTFFGEIKPTQDGYIVYGQNAFVPVSVYVEYDDGSIEDVTYSPYLRVTSSNTNVAFFGTCQDGEEPFPGETKYYTYDSFTTVNTENGLELFATKGIKFGNTTGNATLTASYMGLGGTGSTRTVKCEEAKITVVPQSEYIVMDLASTTQIPLSLTTNVNAAIQWRDPRIETIPDYNGFTQDVYHYPVFTRTTITGGSGKLTVTDCQNNDSSHPLYYNKQQYIQITSPASGGRHKVELCYESAQPATDGVYLNTLGGEITVVVQNGGDKSTMTNLEIQGPDKVLYGDNATFKAIGTYKTSTGDVFTKDLTMLGTWDCSAFDQKGQLKTSGTFQNAKCDYSSNVDVTFTFDGKQYKKNILVYLYTTLEYEFDYDNVYVYKKRQRYSFIHEPLYASVIGIKIRADYKDVNDQVITSTYPGTTHPLSGINYHKNNGFSLSPNSEASIHTYVLTNIDYYKNGQPYSEQTMLLLHHVPVKEIRWINPNEFNQNINYGPSDWNQWEFEPNYGGWGFDF